MKLIDRYVGWQLLVTSTLAVTVLSVVLVLGNVFKQLLELLVKNDTPLELVLSFLGYILPFSLSFTIPWGFLTAVLLVFGKLSAENELIAFRANGVSIPRVCLSALVLALGCVGICFWINIEVAPRAQAKMKEALYDIATSNPLAMFGSDKVIDASSEAAVVGVTKVAKFTAGIDNAIVVGGLETAARLSLPGAQVARTVSAKVAEGADKLARAASGKGAVRKAAASAKKAAATTQRKLVRKAKTVKTAASRKAAAPRKAVAATKAKAVRATRKVRAAVGA